MSASLCGNVTGRRPPGSTASPLASRPKTTSAIAVPALSPGIQASRIALTLARQGVSTGAPASKDDDRARVRHRDRVDEGVLGAGREEAAIERHARLVRPFTGDVGDE